MTCLIVYFMIQTLQHMYGEFSVKHCSVLQMLKLALAYSVHWFSGHRWRGMANIYISCNHYQTLFTTQQQCWVARSVIVYIARLLAWDLLVYQVRLATNTCEPTSKHCGRVGVPLCLIMQFEPLSKPSCDWLTADAGILWLGLHGHLIELAPIVPGCSS